MGKSCVALMVAAPSSGTGKTTFTAALARFHQRAGRRVQVFKCGPDFLDPYWHALASGQPVYQLDLWINGEADVRWRLNQAAQHNDIILIEGVMGLYDGKPSSADIAKLLNIPVACVVDAGSMAETLGAVAYGLQHYPAPDGKRLPWAGVVANRVASERHLNMVQSGLHGGGFLGAIPKDAGFKLPERHLGLVMAHEVADAQERLDALADTVARSALGQLPWQAEQGASWQQWQVEFDAPMMPEVPALLAGRTIAVAQDAAFCFIYQANIDMLRALGAQVVFFSPLQNQPLPACDAVWLPGGYPELHAQALQAASATRAGIAEHIAHNKPLWAECGGMLALMESVQLKDGSTHALWGIVPGHVHMQPRLAALGSQQVDLDIGTLRGHTFHYSRTSTALPVVAHSHRPTSPDPIEAVYQQGNWRASYFHAWFASSPHTTAALFLPQ